MPKVSPEHHEARRGELLDAAARCFARRGFAETSVREIYEEAGVSAGSVYLHFRSKDEIVEALAEQVLARLANEQQLLEAADDPLDAIATLVRSFAAAVALAPSERLSLRVQAWAAAATHPTLAASFRDGFEGMRAAIVTTIERGKRSGRIARSTDSDAAARIVMAAFQGLVLQIVLGTGIDAETYGTVCAAMIEQTLRETAPA